MPILAVVLLNASAFNFSALISHAIYYFKNIYVLFKLIQLCIQL